MARTDVTLGHVVEDFMIGNAHIRICDDYCRDKTPEEVDAILKRIAAKVQPVLEAEERKRRGLE